MYRSTKQRNQMDKMRQLEKLVEDHARKTLAYYLTFEMGERRLAQELRLKIREQYGSEKFMPAMDWKAFFDPAFIDSDGFDQLITTFLSDKGYDKEKFVLPRDRLKNYIWNNARREGRDILNRAEASW